MQTTPDKSALADRFSRKVAETIVQVVGSVTGMKRSTHRKGKYENLEISKAKAEVTTISKARDLIRRLYLREVASERDREETEIHLKVCLDRLCRMGLASVPSSFNLQSLHEWSEMVAPFDISNILSYIKSRKEDLRSKEIDQTRKLFLDPKKRGLWLRRTFGGGCQWMSQLCN